MKRLLVVLCMIASIMVYPINEAINEDHLLEKSYSSCTFKKEASWLGTDVYMIVLRESKRVEGNVIGSTEELGFDEYQMHELKALQECFENAQTENDCENCKNQKIYKMYKKIQEVASVAEFLKHFEQDLK